MRLHKTVYSQRAQISTSNEICVYSTGERRHLLNKHKESVYNYTAILLCRSQVILIFRTDPEF